MVAGAGGRHHSVAARVVAKQEFAGYWEMCRRGHFHRALASQLGRHRLDRTGRRSARYRLTATAGGLQRAGAKYQHDAVPIDLLQPIFDDLMKYGRRNAPARPWLGFYATEVESRLVVVGLADRGPAKRADLRTGVFALAASTRSTIWRACSAASGAQGQAGVEVPITVADRDGEPRGSGGSWRARLLSKGPRACTSSPLELRVRSPTTAAYKVSAQRAQAFAVGRIAQRHAEFVFELVVAHAPAVLPTKASGDMAGAASSREFPGGGARPRSLAVLQQ